MKTLFLRVCYKKSVVKYFGYESCAVEIGWIITFRTYERNQTSDCFYVLNQHFPQHECCGVLRHKLDHSHNHELGHSHNHELGHSSAHKLDHSSVDKSDDWCFDWWES